MKSIYLVQQQHCERSVSLIDPRISLIRTTQKKYSYLCDIVKKKSKLVLITHLCMSHSLTLLQLKAFKMCERYYVCVHMHQVIRSTGHK